MQIWNFQSISSKIVFFEKRYPPLPNPWGVGISEHDLCADLDISCNGLKVVNWPPSYPRSAGSWGKMGFCTYLHFFSKTFWVELSPTPWPLQWGWGVDKNYFSVQIRTFHLIFSKQIPPPRLGSGLVSMTFLCIPGHFIQFIAIFL